MRNSRYSYQSILDTFSKTVQARQELLQEQQAGLQQVAQQISWLSSPEVLQQTNDAAGQEDHEQLLQQIIDRGMYPKEETHEQPKEKTIVGMVANYAKENPVKTAVAVAVVGVVVGASIATISNRNNASDIANREKEARKEYAPS